mmetsp:Transcript_13826/g.23854  ORF Transcript_13826/g.23854 Transcript_13826/m.23854 type:complete len:210 (+) Transcript_13826:81-710(+)
MIRKLVLNKSFQSNLIKNSRRLSTTTKSLTNNRLIRVNPYIQQTRCFADKPADESEPKLTVPDDNGKTPISDEVKDIVEKMLKLDMLDQISLARHVCERIGVPFEAMLSMGAGGGGGGGGGGAAAAPVEEAKEEEAAKTECTVRLTAFKADAKFKVLKEVRKLVPTMPLIECKNLIEKLPADIKESVPMADAEEAKKAIEAVGGTVELA